MKILSRKFILSILLIIIATLFVVWSKDLPDELKLCTGNQYTWVLMATIISYITAKATQSVTGSSHTIRSKIFNKPIQIIDQLKQLIDNVFLLTIIVIVILSIMNYHHIIYNDNWFYMVTTIVGAYNIGNAISKLGPQDE